MIGTDKKWGACEACGERDRFGLIEWQMLWVCHKCAGGGTQKRASLQDLSQKEGGRYE